jgi:hypothetical protein
MSTATKNYSIDAIKEEARHLVEEGCVSRQQKLYTLCQYFPTGEWRCIEAELENNDFLPRDRVIDLLAQESWETDR